MLLKLAYLFLIVETLIRVIILAFASNDYSAYGELMFTFGIANLLGIALALGRPIMCNIEELQEEYRRDIFNVLLLKFAFISLLAFLFGFNYFVIFLGLFYPALGILASRHVSGKLALKLRTLRSIFWINMLLLLTWQDYSELSLMLFTAVLVILVSGRDLLNLRKINQSISLQGVKFSISSLLGLLPKASEQIFVKSMSSNDVLGLFINLRETANVILYLTGPFVSETFYSKNNGKNNFKLFPLIVMAAVFCIFLLSIHNQYNKNLILFILTIGILELFKLLIYIRYEVRNDFTVTWFIKLLIIPSLVVSGILYEVYFTEIDHISFTLTIVIINSILQLLLLGLHSFYRRAHYEN